MSRYLFLVALSFNMIILALQQKQIPDDEQCHDKCGSLRIPFPFYLKVNSENDSSSCHSLQHLDVFHLSCINSSLLYFTIASQSYRVLQFFADGLLLDFPNSSVCRGFNDLNSFTFAGNEYIGISTDNVVALYDCEDSSICKADCERSIMPGCDRPACCYPLCDQNAWHVGDSFQTFTRFGCRGFTSWIVLSDRKECEPGLKLEWAFPISSINATCDANADIVNATSITSGVRCQCRDGFVGDGFTIGVGCLKSCLKDGKEAYGKDCYIKSSGRRRVEILAGILTSAFTITSLTAMFCLLKRPIVKSSDRCESDHQIRCQSTISSQKARRTQLFTYSELEEATKGFADELITVGSCKQGALYAGCLADGTHIAVHKVQCQRERDLIQVLSRVEVLSSISHKNMSPLLGWSIDSGYTPLVVYDYPANGTLEKNLRAAKEQKIYFDWYRRLKVAAETSSLLAFLQCEVSPPIFHHNLQSGCILLDEDLSPRICGFELLNCSIVDDRQSRSKCHGSNIKKSDVYDLGLVLLELITGIKYLDLSSTALQKIRSGKLEEIVDPCLYYHEQPPFRREQIEIVADVATRCLLYGGEGKLGIADVARELMHITKESIDGSSRRGPALEETFSNSSLLQMISMSPDSLYVP